MASTIQVPAQAPDKIASVIALEVEGEAAAVLPPSRASGRRRHAIAQCGRRGNRGLGETGRPRRGPPNVGYWLRSGRQASLGTSICPPVNTTWNWRTPVKPILRAASSPSPPVQGQVSGTIDSTGAVGLVGQSRSAR